MLLFFSNIEHEKIIISIRSQLHAKKSIVSSTILITIHVRMGKKNVGVGDGRGVVIEFWGHKFDIVTNSNQKLENHFFHLTN